MIQRLAEVRRSLSYGMLTLRDIAERAYLRGLDRVGKLNPESYLADACSYLGVDVATVIENARNGRQQHKERWRTKRRQTEAEYQAFYSEDSWYICYQPYSYRTMTWHYVARNTPGPRICEYGCGAAEMTRWLSLRSRLRCRSYVSDLRASP